MAKAALNMMTHLLMVRHQRQIQRVICELYMCRHRADFRKQGIYMNSVDTGWINDENPLEKATRIAGDGFQTPIDEVDAAARILDPSMA